MARKLISKGPIVKAVPLDSRSLVTWGQDHACWGDGRTIVAPTKGSLVRLRPPAEATDGLIASTVAFLKSAGCFTRVMPRPKRDTLAKASRSLTKSLSPRQTVMAMLEEQKASTELVALVTGIMDARGL
jgi:hypothetical protein